MGAPERIVAEYREQTGKLIATGCPRSGWDIVLPVLRRIAPEHSSSLHAGWLEEVMARSCPDPTSPIRQPIRPDAGQAAGFADLINAAIGPQLLADSRCIWILDFLAEQIPEAKFLLLFVRPETALAVALHEGVSPQTFLEDWQATNAQMLRFWRRNRGRACLVEAEAAAAHPQAFYEAISRFGIATRNEQTASQGAECRQLLPLTERLLAANLVGANFAIQSIWHELEAGALPLVDDKVIGLPRQGNLYDEFLEVRQRQAEQAQQLALALADIESAAQRERELNDRLQALQHEAATERGDLQQIARTAIEDKELLAGQLHCMQDVIEGNQRRIAELDADRRAQDDLQQQLRAELSHTQQALAAHEIARKEAGEDNELQALQLEQFQAELEHYVLAYQRANDELLSKSAELGRARYRLTCTLESISWRATAPLRYVLKVLDRASNRQKRVIARQAKLLTESGHFGHDWYLAKYPDVKGAGIDPVRHYLVHGAIEGRNPSPTFDTLFYLARYPDVAESGMNPLVHFVRFGCNEGRQTTP